MRESETKRERERKRQTGRQRESARKREKISRNKKKICSGVRIVVKKTRLHAKNSNFY